MMGDYESLKSAIDTIGSSKQTYGVLKKCEFHFHTPASHDYELIPGKKYNELTISSIIKYSVLVGYLTEENGNEIHNKINFYQSQEYFTELKKKEKPFASFKEYIAYMLIAHKMFAEEIEVAIISDHNTIQGFKKLEYALEEYFQGRIKNIHSKKPIKLFLGVEISCSEQNHLVAIFDENNFDNVQDFLGDVIISELEGTYHTSEYLMKEISINLDGLAYIAHLNTSNLHGSGLYNKTLFSSEYMNVFGLTALDKETSHRNRIRNHNKFAAISLGVIHESDSHSIETIGQRNTWIKFNKTNFASLKKSFHNHPINIYKKKPIKSDVFIKGVTVSSGDNGFLVKSPNKPSGENFTINFSRDLNCIIGGRGSGKSTIINILEIALTLEVNDIATLEFISKHKKIYLNFYFKNVEYILEFTPQVKDLDREYFSNSIFLEKAFIDKSDEKIHLSLNWIQLFRIEQDKFIKLDSQDTSRLLDNIYRRSYSINNIINKINQGKVDDFIKDIVLFGLEGDDFSTYTNNLKRVQDRSFNKYVRENIDEMILAINKRKKSIEKVINDFNKSNNNLLEVVYSPKIKNSDYYLNNLLEHISSQQKLLNTFLTWDDVARYIQQISQKIGYLTFLKLLLKKNYNYLDKELDIGKMVQKSRFNYSDVISETSEVSEKNKPLLYSEIFKKITNNRFLVEESILMWFDVIDEFTLRFNINSREQTSTNGPLMKDVTEMSLGQKVVSILSFVFNFGNYIGDNTPLVIDQPEDNLDNQYIYKNLVESLKQIKNNRQVIIVTHNSTIVTNSGTEQVIVMESNNKKGWVENSGYPSDTKIAKHIINCLEGGVDSFKHKMGTYSLFVEELR
ncbi:Spaf_1101 family AAA-like ATPase [Jeotgalibacillus campisalis]|uniref:Rad50/SbcC-type AAA domain-containing protein n=1 Tax=Jeotgalibacillus campisalis TaxID=220754 RepID=A0A0C2R0D1_9BACL|nr:AAA family ATPase [Jeotgalibacillus campisalis]KIL43785.1 hypothetical protein KR50_33050 [Jeotgalibacillus campisalis]